MKNMRDHNTYFKNIEIILIGTKNDLVQDRIIPKEQALKIVFNDLEGIQYFDVTNTFLSDSRIILWYLMLMRYFLTKDKKKHLGSQ